MQNDDGVDNALENKNDSFSLFCKNSFVFKDVVDRKAWFTRVIQLQAQAQTKLTCEPG